MCNIDVLIKAISSGQFDESFEKLYLKAEVSAQKKRYLQTLLYFKENYPESKNASIYSVPGRTEIGGNHTDHQHGSVLAGAITRDIIAVVSKNSDNIIRITAEGLADNNVDISDLSMQRTAAKSSDSLIEGVASRFAQLGRKTGGFNAVTSSQVPAGSGLSSSAAFEVLIGCILNFEYNNNSLSEVELAKIGQYAENMYFGKNCGLMDQMACALGGICAIDFKDIENPEYEKLDYDFEKSPYSLVIVDTGSSHGDLTEEYSSIPFQMCKVADFFGKQYLRQVDEKDFDERIKELRETVGDRAILRAIHFFSDNNNVSEQIKMLKSGDFEAFIRLVRKSGDSSYKYLQNISSTSSPNEQSIALALAVSEKALGQKGACRVHGGGFAGTIQAFVPKYMVAEYKEKLCRIFGLDSVYVLNIRRYGGIEVTLDLIK